MIDWLHADWPAPAHVHAGTTLRTGGVSTGPYASLNLGAHVGDDGEAVAQNRARLRDALPADPVWLTQVHGTRLLDLDAASGDGEADAAMSRSPGQVCAVLTADCLPVVFCDSRGSVVAAAHAGWRGLLGGVLQNTVAAMQVAPAEVYAWMGPAIGPDAFEVGPEVQQAFILKSPDYAQAFRRGRGDRWFANLYRLAELVLQGCGVERIHGGGLCTFNESERFYSYRRDTCCGRMATLIWIDGN